MSLTDIYFPSNAKQHLVSCVCFTSASFQSSGHSFTITSDTSQAAVVCCVLCPVGGLCLDPV